MHKADEKLANSPADYMTPPVESEEKDEEIQKNEVEEHTESEEAAGTESDQTEQPEQSATEGTGEGIAEINGTDTDSNSECTGNAGQDIQTGRGEPSEDIRQSEETVSKDKMLDDVDRMIEKPSMPKSVARQRLKGWIEDIVRSAAELQRNFEYENYIMALKVSNEVEHEIVEIEKLLRELRRTQDEDMDGSDE